MGRMSKKGLRERFLKSFYAKGRPEILLSCEKSLRFAYEVLISLLLKRRRLEGKAKSL